MAGITPFDVIGELKSLQEKGIIDSGVRKKWEGKVVAEGVTEEIIDQIASFKMREMEILREEQLKMSRKNQATESLEAESVPTEAVATKSHAEREAVLFSLNSTVSDVVSEFRRLAEKRIIDSNIGKTWESRAIKEGVTEEIIEQINNFTIREEEIRRESERDATYRASKNKGQVYSETTGGENRKVSAISIVALVLAVAGLFVPYFVALFLVPVALALGCVAAYKKDKIGKLAVVLAILGVGWIFFVSNQLQAILKDPFAPNFLTSSSSRNQVVTMAKYNRIGIGMSYSEVANIIGAPGEELSRSTTAGYTFSTYVWQNENGSNMTAMFDNGKMSTKAQFGLR